MKLREILSASLPGLAAGAVNGVLGTGGGMVLLPLLSLQKRYRPEELFPASVLTMLPICITSLALTGIPEKFPWSLALPLLAGSTAGGVLAGLLGRRVPLLWLHRILGAFLLWGGIRCLLF